MTVYRSRQRSESLRVVLVRRSVRLLGHVITVVGGTVAGVGIALGQGELVLMAGCAIVFGLSTSAGANTVGRRHGGTTD